MCTYNKPGLFSAVLAICLLTASPARAGNIITDYVAAQDGRIWAQVDLFLDLSWNDINAACPGGICSSGSELNGMMLDGWLWASNQQVQTLLNAYTNENSPVGELYLDSTSSTWAPEMLLDFRPTYVEPFEFRVLNGWTSTSLSSGTGGVGSVVDSGAHGPVPDHAGTTGSGNRDDAPLSWGGYFVHSVPLPATWLLMLLALPWLTSLRPAPTLGT
jgi:hypothetical protein